MHENGWLQRYFHDDASLKKSGPFDLKSPKINSQNGTSFVRIFNPIERSTQNGFKLGTDTIHRG